MEFKNKTFNESNLITAKGNHYIGCAFIFTRRDDKQPIEFEDCSFEYCTFRSLPRTYFENCKFKDCSFKELAEAKLFSDSKFNDCTFANANLDSVVFSWCCIYNSDFHGAALLAAEFPHTKFQNVSGVKWAQMGINGWLPTLVVWQHGCPIYHTTDEASGDIEYVLEDIEWTDRSEEAKQQYRKLLWLITEMADSSCH